MIPIAWRSTRSFLRRHYLARGYVDFNVRSALAELTPGGQTFVITFTLDEGEKYEVGSVDIDSRLRDLKPEQLRELLETKQDETYNADDVETSITALTDEIGKLGYAFVDIEPRLEKRPDEQTIDLTYVINEGSRVYIERIDVVGNVRTLDEVVRREFRLSEGDAYNTALLRRSQQRIQNLGYFEKVELRTLQGSAPDKTRVEIQVTEKSTGELSFGAGYSTSDGALGDVRLTERNLPWARDDRSRPISDLSQRRQEIDFSLTEPYFLDTDITAGLRRISNGNRLSGRVVLRSDHDRRRCSSIISPDRASSSRRETHGSAGRNQGRRQRCLGVHPGRGGQGSQRPARADADL